MERDKIEEAVKKILNSLDKGSRLESVLEEDEGFRVVLAKGSHSDWASFSEGVLEDFAETGKGGHEVKKILGKVVSKLNLAAQKRK
jgi:hypothetical protein